MAYQYPPFQQGVHYPPQHQHQHQPQYQYHQQHQPAVDPFRAYYADRLRQLTFNSRPLIQDLSVTAMSQRDQNNWEGMKIVVEEIEAAVLRALPQQKLPLLYLIDSISKNIGPPYTTHLLPPIIPRLYLRTYREVDGVTKAKMEEMINLWRTSGPNRGDLYGPAVREQIERDIFGSSAIPGAGIGATGVSSIGSNVGRMPSLPSLQQVRTAVQAALENKQREAASRNWDPAVSQQVKALSGIAQLLNTATVSPQELAQIMEQVTVMAPPTPVVQSLPAFTPPPPSLPTPQWNSASPGLNGTPAPGPSHVPPHVPINSSHAAIRPSFQPNFPTPPPAGGVTPNPGSSTPIPSSVAPAQPVPIPAITVPPLAGLPIDVSKILNSLNKSGIVSQPRTPEAETATLKPKSGLDTYEDMIINMDIRLQSIDLNVPRVLSFDHLPHRCKQCGMRFVADDAKFQAHMDWHFRRNRKERESGGRGAHRRWLPRAEEWINDTTESGPSNSVSSPGKLQPAAATQISAERLAQLRQKWVKVPSDSKKAAAVCPVCKEAFKSEYSEDEEEWVWKNAININGVVYHATCRAEQLSALRRLKGTDPSKRSTSGSPRLTPQPESNAAPIKSESASTATAGFEVQAQIKRKADTEKEENGEKAEEGEAKRVKIEPGSETSIAAQDQLVQNGGIDAPAKESMAQAGGSAVDIVVDAPTDVVKQEVAQV
ncbi:hypothetical protein I316_01434 [Kwoniella heveanensis BCC8398]|uniref:CID domain-containing protein n=1 Tax=Kwoniella heveanensis BCC8398 TaxID=1296120 RepID=A0A1B9H0M3_9TREE|nr:hypothetical protein I316_01434 [Kwoniella heveanensis BCC8398]